MAQYRPRFADPDQPDTSLTILTTPNGIDLEVADPALAEELGHQSHVIRQSRGVFDTFPLSIISSGTIDAIAAQAGAAPDPRRFRPNIVFAFSSGNPFDEDELVGRDVTIGSVMIRVDKRDKRCVAINVDPVDSTKNPAVLRTVAQERNACLGVYATVVRTGTVSAGDPVSIGTGVS